MSKRGELRETRVPVPDQVFERLGIAKGNVFADYAHLARKHPEYLANSQAARDFVEHVMAAPTEIMPGNMPDHRMLVRANGGNKGVALEVELRGGKYRVKSAYVLTDAQMMKGRSAAGPGAKPAIPRVDPSQETPSGLLDAPRDAPPDGDFKSS